MPEDIAVLYEVPSNYDDTEVLDGKQIVLVSVWGPADGMATAKDMKPWWDKCDEIMFKVFPKMKNHIEKREPYSSKEVSRLTRDKVLPNQGGECWGWDSSWVKGDSKNHRLRARFRVCSMWVVMQEVMGSGLNKQQIPVST